MPDVVELVKPLDPARLQSHRVEQRAAEITDGQAQAENRKAEPPGRITVAAAQRMIVAGIESSSQEQ